MKQFFAKHQNGSITYSNWPIQETGAESYVFEVNEADLEAVQEGTKDWKIEGGRLEAIASTRKAEREAAEAARNTEKAQKKAEVENIKKKLEKGEASLAEIQATLLKLL
jgi:hypothetical protein